MCVNMSNIFVFNVVIKRVIDFHPHCGGGGSYRKDGNGYRVANRRALIVKGHIFPLI